MIFRRIAEGIKEQDWFIVTIEILIVVVGIFIALQVDDWNEDRKNETLESQFLKRLHNDVMKVEQQASRLKERRLEIFPKMVQSMDILFSRNEIQDLDENTCNPVIGSDFYTFSISGLPALNELITSGRMYLLKDAVLSKALIDWEQSRVILDKIILVTSIRQLNLISNYPDLITMTPYVDEASGGEIRATFTCNTAGMRANQSFLNNFSLNIDNYDAYLRDGLIPWVSRFELIHKLLDTKLEITHESL